METPDITEVCPIKPFVFAYRGMIREAIEMVILREQWRKR